MIVYPEIWQKEYGLNARKIGEGYDYKVSEIVGMLVTLLRNLNVSNLAYSGGIDSTIILACMNLVYRDRKISTFTIASRDNHPDIVYARMGSKCYGSNHTEFIEERQSDCAYRQFFSNLPIGEIICCDGIDEFMCGYYAHQDLKYNTYFKLLQALLPKHLLPLNLNSGGVKVYLPYLDEDLIDIYNDIPFECKVDAQTRKKVVVEIAEYLRIPQDIIKRNKYGFCDAFLEQDK